MDWRFLAALLLHLQVSSVAALECSIGIGIPYNMHEIPISPNEGSLLLCPDIEKDAFSNGERIVHVMCVDGQPTYTPGPDCITYVDVHADCNETAINKPEDVVVIQAVSGSSTSLAGIYYKCSNPNMAFLSGKPGRLSQCLNGSFTPIYDACEEGCEIPRSCADLVEMGENKTGLYRVIPSGDSLATPIFVWCEMNDTTNGAGTGWTTLLRHFQGKNALSNQMDEYEKGIGDPEQTWQDNSNYFLGLDNFYYMNRDAEDTKQNFVLQFIMEKINGEQFHMTYNGLTIVIASVNETTGYMLDGEMSAFHGDAGNGLFAHIGYLFTCEQYDDGCWFGFKPKLHAPFTLFSSAQPMWIYKKLKYIHIRFRPEYFDAEDSCPPKFTSWPAWEHTLVDIPVSRWPGVNITYQCVGEEFYMEMETIETAICIDNGTAPYWNHSFSYPCKYRHPPTFKVSNAGDSSYKDYNETKFGIAEAEQTCSAQNASLAEITSSTLEYDEEFDYSYTANVFSDGEIVPPLNITNLKCTESCQASEDKPCILLNSDGEYKASSCSEPHSFLCKHPAFCVDSFTLHEGSCYKIIEIEGGDFMSAVEACNADMAALVFPESLEVLDFLAKLLEEHVGTANLPQDALIGLYSLDGLWNGTIGYQPESALINLTDASSPWQALKVSQGDTYELYGAPFTGGTALYAICQRLGPMGCSQDPPDISLNMTSSGGNTTSYALYHEVTYTCDIGYFVNGTVPEMIQTSICQGQLGEWMPEPLECLPVEVCTEPFPKPPSDLITNTTTSTTRLLTGSILYTCPPNMSVADGSVEQMVNCTENEGEFGFEPSEIQPCDACMEMLNISLALSTWDTKPIWKIGELVSAECIPDHHASVGNKTLYANCTEDGWVIHGSCYPACTDPPPAPGLNVVMEELLSDTIGSKINYSCSPDYYLPITEDSPDLRTSFIISCEKDPEHMWTPNISLSCSKTCMDDPPKPEGLITSDWDSFNHSVGAEVTYDCPDGLLFGDMLSSWVITCEENGNWTPIENPLNFICRMPAPMPPPPPPFQATMIKAEDNFWVKSTVNYSCDHAQMSPLGVTYVILTCTTSRWTPPLDPEFVCLNICTSPPPGITEGTLNNMTGFPYWGTVIEYWCLDGYLFPDYTTTRLSICQDGQWTMTELPPARNDLPPPPDPPSPDVNVTKPPYEVGAVLRYTCPDDKRFPDGKQYTTVNRTATGWTYLDPYYVCLNVCVTIPHKAYGNITSNYTGMSVWGSAVEYRCKGLFHGGGTTRINYCLPGGTWSLFYLSYCMNVGKYVSFFNPSFFNNEKCLIKNVFLFMNMVALP